MYYEVQLVTVFHNFIALISIQIRSLSTVYLRRFLCRGRCHRFRFDSGICSQFGIENPAIHGNEAAQPSASPRPRATHPLVGRELRC